MSIVTSKVVSDEMQEAGVRLIRERHTDHLGVVHERIYRAPAGFDAQGALAQSAVVLAEQLAQAEAEALLGGGNGP